MGIVLLFMRIGVADRACLKKVQKRKRIKGNIFKLFKNIPTFTKYLSVILVGLQFGMH